jgi:hypothetical protein
MGADNNPGYAATEGGSGGPLKEAQPSAAAVLLPPPGTGHQTTRAPGSDGGPPPPVPVDEVDLTQDPHEQKAAASPPPLPPAEKKFDPEPAREKFRGVFTLVLLGILCVLIVSSLATMWFRKSTSHDVASISDLLELLKVFVSPLIALVSTAIGFYFGSITKNS